jgi:hypothetical protein
MARFHSRDMEKLFSHLFDIGTGTAGLDSGGRPVSAASLMQPARVQSRDMEKLRKREEREALDTWRHVVDFCAANQVCQMAKQ